MRIDWFAVITQLEAQGVTLRSQANAAGVAPATVYYWKTGGEPKYRNGALLLDVYATRVSTGYPVVTRPST